MGQSVPAQPRRPDHTAGERCSVGVWPGYSHGENRGVRRAISALTDGGRARQRMLHAAQGRRAVGDRESDWRAGRRGCLRAQHDLADLSYGWGRRTRRGRRATRSCPQREASIRLWVQEAVSAGSGWLVTSPARVVVQAGQDGVRAACPISMRPLGTVSWWAPCCDAGGSVPDARSRGNRWG